MLAKAVTKFSRPTQLGLSSRPRRQVFLRRVLDTIAKLHIANHKAKLSVDFHKDIKWWLKYLQAFNGVVYYRHVDHAVVHTDACNIGGGAFFSGDWRYFHWKGDLRVSSNIHINYKEVLAVVLAAKYWHRDWANHNITVITDSTVAKAIINRGTCKSKLIMGSLRELFWLMEISILNCMLFTSQAGWTKYQTVYLACTNLGSCHGYMH